MHVKLAKHEHGQFLRGLLEIRAKFLQLILDVLKCTAGTAIIEATIVLPVAISLLVGGVEFGFVFSAYGTASKSMRDAARYLARVPADKICSWGLDDAKNIAVYGKLNPTAADKPILPKFSLGDVSLIAPDCSGPVSSPSTIELKAVIPYSTLMFAHSWTLNVRHEEPYIGG